MSVPPPIPILAGTAVGVGAAGNGPELVGPNGARGAIGATAGSVTTAGGGIGTGPEAW